MAAALKLKIEMRIEADLNQLGHAILESQLRMGVPPI